MMDGYLTNPLSFVLGFVFEAYALIVLLRFFFQLTRVDFYNPISQFIVKLTSPVLIPLRRYIPAFKQVDTASLVLAWLVKAAELMLIALIQNGAFIPLLALLGAIPGVVELAINIFLYAIIIQAVLSWVNPDPYNPAINMLHRLTAPVLRPIQRHMPLLGGLDLSPVVAILALMVLKMLVLPPLNQLAVWLGS